MARDAKIIIRVPEEVKEEFQKIAEGMGMTMSSLGAYCIGQYLRSERNKTEVQNKMLDNLMPMFKSQMGEFDMSNPEVRKVAEETLKLIINNNQQ